jgi:hypothetical protein
MYSSFGSSPTSSALPCLAQSNLGVGNMSLLAHTWSMPFYSMKFCFDTHCRICEPNYCYSQDMFIAETVVTTGAVINATVGA